MKNTLLIQQAAKLIANATYLTAFTGAGISAESGIPPFRGENGIWNSYDPKTLDINFFLANPKASWTVIHQLFYKYFSKAQPNAAHVVLAKWQNEKRLKRLITQNIDHLHQDAGSKQVVCFHGTSLHLVCLDCSTKVDALASVFEQLPPYCGYCGGLLKPDFIFFGEGIPEAAYKDALHAARQTDVMLVIGTSGEVSPANQIPVLAKQNGAVIIEINHDPSLYTQNISSLFLQGKAGKLLSEINVVIEQNK